jgi:hypothetical protein
MHHIISDGWSIGILVRELIELYDRPARLPELPVQYVDFAAWQREWLQGELLDKQVSYWKEKLAGAPSLLSCRPTARVPPTPTYRGARYPRRHPAGADTISQAAQ